MRNTYLYGIEIVFTFLEMKTNFVEHHIGQRNQQR